MVYARVPDGHVQTALDVDDRHGVRPELRRPRRRARRGARGDRDVRGHAAGARARPLLRGGLRTPRARAAGDRHRRRDLVGDEARRSRPTTGRCTPAGTSSSPPPGNIEHNKFIRMLQRAQSQQRPPAGGPRVRRPLVKAPPPGFRFAREGHRAVPRLPRRAGNRALRPPPLRRFDPRLRSSAARHRRGSSRRSARSVAWPTPSTRSRRSTPTPDWSGSTSARARRTSGPVVEIAAEQLADIAAGNLRSGRDRPREGEPQRTDHALDGVDVEPDEQAREVAHHRHASCSRSTGSSRRSRRSRPTRSQSSPGFCSRPRSCRSPASAPSERVFRDAARRINPACSPRAA